jgi:hypothetical protein
MIDFDKRLYKTATTATSSELTSLLNQAIAAHFAGRSAEAEALYRQVLNAYPNHFDSLHMLGVIFFNAAIMAKRSA